MTLNEKEKSTFSFRRINLAYVGYYSAFFFNLKRLTAEYLWLVIKVKCEDLVKSVTIYINSWYFVDVYRQRETADCLYASPFLDHCPFTSRNTKCPSGQPEPADLCSRGGC